MSPAGVILIMKPVRSLWRTGGVFAPPFPPKEDPKEGVSMTDILGKDRTAEERGNRVERVLLIVLFCNLLVAAAKIVIGLATNLQSVLADGYHSLSDGFSNVIGLVGVAIAKRPSDEGHTYGHSRYETLASLAIVALMAYLGISVLTQAVRGLAEPSFRVPSSGEFAVVVGTLVFNILVARLEDRAGKRLSSPILRSDARHTLSDIAEVEIGRASCRERV